MPRLWRSARLLWCVWNWKLRVSENPSPLCGSEASCGHLIRSIFFLTTIRAHQLPRNEQRGKVCHVDLAIDSSNSPRVKLTARLRHLNIRYDQRTDVFSFGVMLFECALGEQICDLIKRKELVEDAEDHSSLRSLLSYHAKGHRLIVPRDIKAKFTKGGLRES